jgi:hypothetical protein
MNQDHIIIYILGALLLVSVVQHIRVHIQLINLTKQTNNPMATFTDLQTASAALTTAATGLDTAISAYVSAHATDITAAQADTIVADINAATASLTAATATLTPTA